VHIKEEDLVKNCFRHDSSTFTKTGKRAYLVDKERSTTMRLCDSVQFQYTLTTHMPTWSYRETRESRRSTSHNYHDLHKLTLSYSTNASKDNFFQIKTEEI
jgi:hypothetical protein